MAKIGRQQRQQGLHVGVLSMPCGEPRHDEAVSQIMRPHRLAVVETGELAGRVERNVEPSRRQAIAPRAEKKPTILRHRKRRISMAYILAQRRQCRFVNRDQAVLAKLGPPDLQDSADEVDIGAIQAKRFAGS